MSSSPRICDYCQKIRTCDCYTMYDTKLRMYACAECFNKFTPSPDAITNFLPKRTLSKPIIKIS